MSRAYYPPIIQPAGWSAFSGLHAAQPMQQAVWPARGPRSLANHQGSFRRILTPTRLLSPRPCFPPRHRAPTTDSPPQTPIRIIATPYWSAPPCSPHFSPSLLPGKPYTPSHLCTADPANTPPSSTTIVNSLDLHSSAIAPRITPFPFPSNLLFALVSFSFCFYFLYFLFSLFFYIPFIISFFLLNT